MEADGAELEAPRDQAVTAVLEEGERVEHAWTAPRLRRQATGSTPTPAPGMRGWLHLFAFFGAIVAGAVLIPLASVARRPRRVLGRALLPDDLRPVRHQRALPPAPLVTARLEDHEAARPLDDLPVHRRHLHAVRAAGRRPADRLLGPRRGVGRRARRRRPQAHLADRARAGSACRSTSAWAGSPSSSSPTSCTSPGSPRWCCWPSAALLYTVGGVAYGIRKPNPWPGTFGYHEVFHAMTIVAAICHYIAVYFAMYNSPFL